MQYFEAFNSVMYSWWSAPLGNVRVLPVCFARIAFSSLQTWPVSELKVASGKPKRKHCSKRTSQKQEEKENSKKSRPLEQMPHRRAPVFLLSPGINTLGTTLQPCWIYPMSRGLVSTNQTFFASEAKHSWTALRMSRPLFVGSYLQVTWWALGRWKERKICFEW